MTITRTPELTELPIALVATQKELLARIARGGGRGGYRLHEIAAMMDRCETTIRVRLIVLWKLGYLYRDEKYLWWLTDKYLL